MVVAFAEHEGNHGLAAVSAFLLRAAQPDVTTVTQLAPVLCELGMRGDVVTLSESEGLAESHGVAVRENAGNGHHGWSSNANVTSEVSTSKASTTP